MSKLWQRAAPNASGYRDVTPIDVASAAADGSVRIVDVREPDEVRGELGRIPITELCPLAQVATRAQSWPRDEEIVLVCRSGNRSSRAAAELTRLGFTHVMNMQGGMLAYNEASLLVARD